MNETGGFLHGTGLGAVGRLVVVVVWKYRMGKMKREHRGGGWSSVVDARWEWR
jgi:hypothetical protein